MMGYIYDKIRTTQSYLAQHAYDEEGKMSAKHQRCIARVNHAMIPWIRALSKISDHSTLKKLDTWWSNDGTSHEPLHTTQHMLYARVNLKTRDMYIGETESWLRRQLQHTYNTYRHNSRCTNPCGGCGDHKKYQKHQRVQPHEWITVPLMVAPNREVAKRLETLLRQRMKPNLNTFDRQYWLLKDTYITDYRKAQRKEKRAAPWRKPKPALETEHRASRRAVTKYSVNGITRYDLQQILSNHESKEITVSINMGHHDLTNWGAVRTFYAHTRVSVQTPYTQFTVPMKEWTPRAHHTMQTLTRCTITLTPVRQEMRNREEQNRVLQDIEKEKTYLERASEADLHFVWRVIDDLEKCRRYKYRKLLYQECTRRYGCTMKPITIAIPYIREFDIVKVKRHIVESIRAQPWPQFIKDWHVSKIKITTTGTPSISDILTNVTQPKRHVKRCVCQRIAQRVPGLPCTDGHIFFIGRDLAADPARKVLGINATNVPRQTWFDTFRTWERVRKQLPEELRTPQTQWKKTLFKCLKKKDSWNARGCPSSKVPNTKEVYQVKKAFENLVIGPLDKNNGELWGCCPKLYQKMLEKLYSEEAGYDTVYCAKLSAHRKKKYAIDELPEQIVRTSPPPKNQRGGEQDLVKLFKCMYKARGWDAYAPFNNKGGLNIPYALPKAKNVTEHAVRAAKLNKGRPIAPGTKHPMRRLLHYVGRAWSFVTSQLPGEHFVLNRSDEVPAFIEQANATLRKYGPLKTEVLDIEGAFPSMPKPAIRASQRDWLHRIKSTTGHDGVYVPKYSDAQRCAWKSKRKNMQKIPFEIMIDVAEFSLDNAFVRMPDGAIKKQRNGIPMGDPISPGMTIGTCAWMEDRWMKMMAPVTKRSFAAKRFMDDVFLIYADNADTKDLVKDLKRCYESPLKLEPAKPGTFLETRYDVDTSTAAIGYKLKNDNERETSVWRYHHYHSYAPFMQKRATLTACLKKVQRMARDTRTLRASALAKIDEFKRLDYPQTLLRKACTFLAASSGESTWISVRNQV